MNKQYEYNKRMQNRNINIKGLIKYLWSKKYWFLLCALVFGAIFGCFSNTLDTKHTTTTISEEDTRVVEELKKAQYHYNEKIRYLSESKLMEIDPYETYYTALQFSVVAETEEKSATLVKMYKDYIESGTISGDVLLLLKNVEIEGRHLEELIVLSDVSRAVFNGESAPHSECTFLARAVYMEAAECEKIADAIVLALENYSKELETVFGSHDLELIKRVSSVKVDEGLANAKEGQYEALNRLKTIIDNLTNQLNAEQQQYLMGEPINKVARENEGQAKISIKHALMGAVLGMAFLGVIFLVLYILKQVLQFPQDIENIFGQNLLGNLNVKGQEDGVNYICESILFKCQKSSIKELCISSSDNDILEDEKVRRLVGELQSRGLTISQMTGLTTKASALKALSSVGSVCFIEKTGKSKYQNIYNELCLCAEYEVDILGIVLAE